MKKHKEREKDVQLRDSVRPMGASTQNDQLLRSDEMVQCMHCPKKMKKNSDAYVRTEIYTGTFRLGLFPQNVLLCRNCYALYIRKQKKAAKESKLRQLPFSGLNFEPEKGKNMVLEKKPEDQVDQLQEHEKKEPQTTTVRRGIKARTSYVSPSREGKVTITAHVDPELKEAVNKLADQSNLTFNEFITAILKREVASPTQQTDETLHLSEEALEKTREAEKALHRLTVNLSSSHSR